MTSTGEAPALAGRGGRRSEEYDHLGPLLAEFAALSPHDPQRRALREQLAVAFLPVAHHVAARYRNRGEPTDDLQQVAAVALLGALDRYQPDRGDFLSFAIPTITGELRRHFRDRTWSMHVPRRLKDLQGVLRQATDELATRLQRAPRPSDLAAHLAIPIEEVLEALEASNAYNNASLDASTTDAGLPVVESMGGLDSALAKVEYRHALRPILDELPERERTILILRFFHDMTQTQIAEAVGLSQMHISRLLATTLATIRRRLDSD